MNDRILSTGSEAKEAIRECIISKLRLRAGGPSELTEMPSTLRVPCLVTSYDRLSLLRRSRAGRRSAGLAVGDSCCVEDKARIPVEVLRAPPVPSIR